MCRLLAYLGSPMIIDNLLYQPKNSLVNQSVNAKEIEEPLNGDGFGIGWYVPEVNYEPVFRLIPHGATETSETLHERSKPPALSLMFAPQVLVKFQKAIVSLSNTRIS